MVSMTNLLRKTISAILFGLVSQLKKEKEENKMRNAGLILKMHTL